MSSFITKSLLFIFISACFYFSASLHAEGIKELRPDSNYICYLNVGNGGGGYSCFATPACPPDQKLYVRVGSPGEQVYIGFGGYAGTLTFRIKNLDNTVVYGPYSINATSEEGFIKYYSQAEAGPTKLNPAGYKAMVFKPLIPGDYNIEIDPKPMTLFDITVIDTTALPLAAIDGRLWSKDWGINTANIELPMAGFWATQYIYTEDSIVTSIYYNEMRGNVFDVTSTRNGCYPPPVPWDSSCKSTEGNHHYAQYKIFVNDPDTVQFPTGVLGVILPSSVTVTRDCDGSFDIQFSVNKPGSANVEIEINPLPGHQPEDVSILDSVDIGVNTIVWDGINGLGVPVPIGDSVYLSIIYVNGLTNLALYDVERHQYGFIISMVRPPGPPIATYWNDTLLANKGGQVQLSGCYSSLPTSGCHAWQGNYNGVGIGSWNTVNTWWYAASTSQIGMFAVAGTPATPQGISGPDTLCMSTIATYTVVPNPLPGTDSSGYEWVLTDVASGTTLMDSLNALSSITINYGLYPPGQKRLKVRGHSNYCGTGNYGPGANGILVGVNMSPVIINTNLTDTVCSGTSTDLLIESTNPLSTYSYTATATSPFITGFAPGSQNPIQQLLTNAGTEVDSVIYNVVPFANPCLGDTATFYLLVPPVSQVTNSLLDFTACSGETTDILLTSNVPGCLFSWEASCGSASVTGFSDGTGPSIAQSLINSGTTPETVSYVVTPSTIGCNGPPKSFTVTVNPVPDLSNSPLMQDLCSGDSLLLILTSHVTGSLFTWTAEASSPDVSGYSSNTTNPTALINEILVNASVTPQTVTYHITPQANGCDGPGYDYVVTVIPAIVLTTNPLSATTCSGDTVRVGLSSSPPGGLFTWSCSASSPNVSGYTPQTVPTDSLVQSVINSGTTQETVTYTISSDPNGCEGPDTSFVITVNPRLPVSINISASANPVCEGIPVTFSGVAVNGGSTPSYQWQVNGINAGTNNPIYTFYPASGDQVSCILLSSEPCTSGNPASGNPIIMTVTEAPEVTFTPCFDTITATNAKPILLRGGIPLGGTYSGSGVSSVSGGVLYYFNPLVAGAGTHQISYTYTNSALCEDARYAIIDTRLASPFSCGNLLMDIRDNQSYPTVQIGSQCWMAANLNYGTEIPYTSPQRDNCIPEKYLQPPPGLPQPGEGSVYQWDELMRYQDVEEIQGFCPPGWHVPSEADWNQLFAVFLGNGFAGSPLLYSGYSGFNAQLAGIDAFNQSWHFDGFATLFWSSTAHGSWKAWAHGMNAYNYSVSYYPGYRANAFSVRCLRD
ncbi:MAG: hypothetical protein IH596_03045 [Bacteroidales bacterium]|nr:hypothetical protein [Bacteroidales bacterium]